jgi:hypothetical protein
MSDAPEPRGSLTVRALLAIVAHCRDDRRLFVREVLKAK